MADAQQQQQKQPEMVTGYRPAESTHWYDRAGNPVWKVESKDGKKLIKPTLTQARRLGLLPGVTSIIGVMDKPGLVIWKINQTLEAAATTPWAAGDTDATWKAKVKETAERIAKEAAERGTQIHAAIEQHYTDGSYADGLRQHVDGVRALLDPVAPRAKWTAERSVAHRLGYGTKVDLCAELSDRVWVLDFKSKEAIDKDKLKLTDEHLMQLAAARMALSTRTGGAEHAECAIVFVSRQVMHPEPPLLVKATPDDLSRGWNMFQAAAVLWQHRARHYPSW